MTVPVPKTAANRLPNPPRADVVNPKNKHCAPCNMDFAKRGAFIEHCRNTHRMNIKMASSANKSAPVAPTPPKPEMVTPQVPVQTPVSGTGSTGYKCDYCPKSFANRSNKNRHMLLSCEVARPQMRQRGENGGGGGGGMMAQQQVLNSC